MAWTPGDVSGSETLTDADHIYYSHVNELRVASAASTAITSVVSSYIESMLSAADAQTARNILGAQAKTVVVVGPSGSDADYECGVSANHTQINAAIDSITSGVVFILAGDYSTSGTINLKSDVTVMGAGVGVTNVSASVGTSSWAFAASGSGQTKTLRSNIWVKSMTIRNVTASHTAIISNTTNAGFIDVEAVHTDWSQVRETLVLQHCENAYFTNCFIHDPSGNGVQVNSCDYFYVTGNRVVNFYDNVARSGAHHLDDGIDIDEDFLDTGTVPSRHGVVANNWITGSTNGNNIRVASSQHVYVSNNFSLDHECTAAASVLVNTYSGGGHPDTHDIFITDNHIINGDDSGIKVLDTGSTMSRVFISRNNITDCGNAAASGQIGTGITIDANDVTVEYNTLDNCGKSGGDGGAIMLYLDGDNTVLRGNTVTNSPGAAIRFWNGDGLQTYAGIVLVDSSLANNSSSYGGTDITTFTRCRNNDGLNPDVAYDTGNSGASKTITRVNGLAQTVTMTNSCTFTFTDGVVKGDRLILQLTQDGTGGRVATWPANVKLASSDLVLSAAASAVDVVTFMWDGTYWREVSRALGGDGFRITDVLTINGGNGNLLLSSTTDGGDFNIYHAETGTKTLAIYGSAGNVMDVNLLDGVLKTGSTTRIENDGTLKNVYHPIATKTANYTATTADRTILCDATSGSLTIALPAVATSTGLVLNIKKVDVSANTVTLDGNASETIDGATTAVLTTQWESITIHCNGTAWFIL